MSLQNGVTSHVSPEISQGAGLSDTGETLLSNDPTHASAQGVAFSKFQE